MPLINFVNFVQVDRRIRGWPRPEKKNRKLKK